MEAYKKATFKDYILRFLDVCGFDLNEMNQNTEMLIYAAIALLVPLLFRQPQLLVGSLVNAILISSALNLKMSKIIPTILLPSVSAFLGGYLFGPMNLSLLYIIPFIWVGNLILVKIFKILKVEKNQNYFLVAVTGSVLKSVFIFTAVFLFVKFTNVGEGLLFSLASLQIVTALIGSFMAFGVQKARSYLI